MTMDFFLLFIAVVLCHEVAALKPNLCEFSEDVFEYVPKKVVVQQKKEHKEKGGILSVLNPRNFFNKNDYENVTKTQLVVEKQTRTYLACCFGYIKEGTECVLKSSNTNSSIQPSTASTAYQPSTPTMMETIMPSPVVIIPQSVVDIITTVAPTTPLLEVVTELAMRFPDAPATPEIIAVTDPAPPSEPERLPETAVPPEVIVAPKPALSTASEQFPEAPVTPEVVPTPRSELPETSTTQEVIPTSDRVSSPKLEMVSEVSTTTEPVPAPDVTTFTRPSFQLSEQSTPGGIAEDTMILVAEQMSPGTIASLATITNIQTDTSSAETMSLPSSSRFTTLGEIPMTETEHPTAAAEESVLVENLVPAENKISSIAVKMQNQYESSESMLNILVNAGNI